ncbi:MAG: GDSL family lipase [Planctomycetes bacterium]|nr:GDSL family lipase [Planctomycetota bacterium]
MFHFVPIRSVCIPHLAALICLLACAAAGGIAAETPAIIPVAKDGNAEWMQRHQAFVAAAKKGGVPLLFLGDSITDFWGTTGKEVWDKTFAPQHAANFGIAADKVENVLWRVTNGELDGIAPKVVVLMIGINNCWSAKRGEWDQKGQEIATGTRQIIDVIHAKSPRSKILLMAIFPLADGMDLSAKAANALTATFDDGKNIRVLDIGSKLAGADGTAAKDILPDGLHPSAKGYQIWADAIAAPLKDLMAR